MARIRTIKPEFWTSEQVVDLSPMARLLFIGMWSFCDDRGVHPASAKTLKMEVFPGDDISAEKISGLVSEIIEAGLITEYQAVDGKKYWHVSGWERHQKVEKPNFKHPAPPKFVDHSSTIRRPFADHSTTEGKGREGKRELEMEGSGGGVDDTPPAPTIQNEKIPPTPSAQGEEFTRIREVIATWRQADNGAALKKICEDQKFSGPVENEITRFITNNLGKEPYRTRIILNPLNFFCEQFPGWLCLPAAQRARKSQQGPIPVEYSPPSQRSADADLHISLERALELIDQHAPSVSDLFTDQHIKAIRTKLNSRSATETILAIAKTLHNGPPALRTNAHEIPLPCLKINK